MKKESLLSDISYIFLINVAIFIFYISTYFHNYVHLKHFL